MKNEHFVKREKEIQHYSTSDGLLVADKPADGP